MFQERMDDLQRVQEVRGQHRLGDAARLRRPLSEPARRGEGTGTAEPAERRGGPVTTAPVL